ncbi:hypothetical protein U2E19_18785 [Acinetobacter baumannii]|uniref:hypothetical protein n=1 Tax=Acinetobacter baumannii TaxID=470 RepID=UPI00338F3071
MSEFKVGDKVVFKECSFKQEPRLVTHIKNVGEVTYLYFGCDVGLSAKLMRLYLEDADLGDDFPIENRISPLCKSKDV